MVNKHIYVQVYLNSQCEHFLNILRMNSRPLLVCVILHISQLGNTALMMAAEEGYTEVVVELIKAGANLNLQNKVQL